MYGIFAVESRSFCQTRRQGNGVRVYTSQKHVLDTLRRSARKMFADDAPDAPLCQFSFLVKIFRQTRRQGDGVRMYTSQKHVLDTLRGSARKMFADDAPDAPLYEDTASGWREVCGHLTHQDAFLTPGICPL